MKNSKSKAKQSLLNLFSKLQNIIQGSENKISILVALIIGFKFKTLALSLRTKKFCGSGEESKNEAF